MREGGLESERRQKRGGRKEDRWVREGKKRRDGGGRSTERDGLERERRRKKERERVQLAT